MKTLIAAALAVAVVVPAHADGLLVPPPSPVVAAPLPYTLPYRQGPPMRSCITTAIQLGYQTGSRYVANAAIEACKAYAPVQYPRRDPPPMPLGGFPPPDGDGR